MNTDTLATLMRGLDPTAKVSDAILDEVVPRERLLQRIQVSMARTERESVRKSRAIRDRVAVRIGAVATTLALIVAGAASLLGSTPGAITSVAIPAAAAGQWNLAGYITNAGWHEANSTGPLPTSIQATNQFDCPTASTCYAVGNDNSSQTQNSQGVITVTRDGGASWASVLAPDNGTLFESISCLTVDVCRALGEVPNSGISPELYSTKDGGSTWSLTPVPGPNMGNLQLACASELHCVVFGSVPTSNSTSISREAYVTSDAGNSWSPVTLPASFTPSDSAQSAIECFGDGRCVAAGTNSATTAIASRAAIIYSVDFGATWLSSTAPPVATSTTFLTCASSQNCLMVASATDGSQTPSGVLTSADGGATWTPENASGLTAVSGRPFSLNVVACSTTGQCWASGQIAQSSCQGSCPYDPAQAAILSSTNNGRTWDSVSLPQPQNASLQFEAVNPVVCASATNCFAVGILATTSSAAAGGEQPIQQDAILSWTPGQPAATVKTAV